jgi:predicted glycosyltransferase
MRTLWFDIINTPHVHFLKPIIERYNGHARVTISVRDFSETVELARRNIDARIEIIGRHGGSSRIMKIGKLLARVNSLKAHINGFDYALSCGGFESCLFARLRRKVSVVFDDNDVSPNWMYAHLADHLFAPDAIARGVLLKQGFKAFSIHQYSGYKEDMYVADYVPDTGFLKHLPFSDYVVVRPENVMASYSDKRARTIVPQLLRLLSYNGFNTLYLPRINTEYHYAYGVGRVFIPREPINGLDACFYSRAVLSGAGSLTREAACLGKPAVSFYAGKRLLAVDRQMMAKGWLLHSRNPQEILEHVLRAKSRQFDRIRSKVVQNSVFHKLDKILVG